MIVTLLAALAAQSALAAAPDYKQDATWLCRPGRSDACTVGQDVTTVAANGKRKIEKFVAAKAPKFDCFYVYPTVSTDPGANSDMTADPAENQVVAAQAARFRAQCRVFAPLYRQVTLSALRAGMMTGAPITGRELAYADVKAAWDDYLARDNNGRGVILFGHSQGSGLLKQLIAREIEGKPVASRMIAAYLAGTNVVPGDLKSTPPCTSATQTGCVVAWVSFRSDAPPPANSRFGTGASPAICVNAASLNGGEATARAIFSTTGVGASSAAMGPWSKDGPAVTTPYVAVPGLISTECVTKGGFGYLNVTVNADPADARTDTIVGDVMVGGQILKDWGLHLVDMPVVMGDLVALAGTQGAAWGKAKR
ncbi:MAG: DUF3089 domain-containing protein [Pseudomonadota bacterium]